MAQLRKPFDSALEDLINEHGVDAKCGIPDYILAAFMVQSLEPLKTMVISCKKDDNTSDKIKTISLEPSKIVVSNKKSMTQSDIFDYELETHKHAVFIEDRKIKKR